MVLLNAVSVNGTIRGIVFIVLLYALWDQLYMMKLYGQKEEVKNVRLSTYNLYISSKLQK